MSNENSINTYAPLNIGTVPDDWQPTEAHKEFARLHNLDIDAEVARFRAFFQAAAKAHGSEK